MTERLDNHETEILNRRKNGFQSAPIGSIYLQNNLMNIFKSFTMKWWQGSLFKYSMIFLGIIIGATWPEVFSAWRSVLLVLFALPAIYLSWVWWKQ